MDVDFEAWQLVRQRRWLEGRIASARLRADRWCDPERERALDLLAALEVLLAFAGERLDGETLPPRRTSVWTRREAAG